MGKRLTGILVTILVVLIIAIGAIEAKDYFMPSNNDKPEVKKEIEIGPYKVSAYQTDYLKTVGDKLKTAYDAKPNSTATIDELATYFVADYFTLRNKFVMDEVGGMGLVYSGIKKTFKENAIDSYYMDLTEYRNEYGADNLPEVNSVKVLKRENVSKRNVDLNAASKKNLVSFKDVSISWSYLPNDVVNPKALKIVDRGVLRLALDKNGTWWIYEFLG